MTHTLIKKIIGVGFTGYLIFFPSSSIAQIPVSPVIPPPAPVGGDRIGVVAAVKGQVEVGHSGAVGKVVGSGAPVYLGDTVSTDAKGQLQILLQDQTTFTIGPNSTIIIDQFVYNPKTDEGELQATIAKGVFRFVSGKIAKKKPENMTVKFPVGSLGVRGTIVAGEVTRQSTMAVLLGPGAKNQANEPAGSFTLNNTVGNQTFSTQVTRANFGSEIGGADMVPRTPFRVPDNVIGKLTDNFSMDQAFSGEKGTKEGEQQGDRSQGERQGPPTQGEGRSPDAGGRPGVMPGPGTEPGGPVGNLEGRFQGGFEAQGFAAFNNFGNQNFLNQGDFGKFLKDAAQFQQGGGGVQGGTGNSTTFDQLKSIDPMTDGNNLSNPAFLKFYSQSNVPTSNSGTQYNVQMDIRLDADVRKFAGGNSRVKFVPGNASIGTFQFNLSEVSYGASTGNAEFNYTNLANQIVGMGSCSGCTADVHVFLKNATSTSPPPGDLANIATKAEQDVVIKNSVGTVIAQDLVGESPRQAGNGLSPP